METRIADCPLGAKCEEVKDDIMYVCPWYVKVRGKNPQSEEELDESRCAIAWGIPLTIENTQMQRQTGAAIESLRNIVANQNNNVLQPLIDAINRNKQIEG